jgi:hypothetical protein
MTDATESNEIVSLFANFINYLNASYFEGQFTHKHEEARANLEVIYVTVSKTPTRSPSKEQCISFYNDVRLLENVTFTKDPDYVTYKRLLRKYIAVLD